MSKPKRSAKRTRQPVAKRALPKSKLAAKKSASAPKKSASKVSSVDGYVQTLPALMRPIVNRLRALVAMASPEAIEAFKWSQPVYEANGPFAYIKAHSGHVNFGFWRGAVLEAPDGLLQGDGVRMRHLKIATLGEVNDVLVQALVRQAVLLNSRLGNLARR